MSHLNRKSEKLFQEIPFGNYTAIDKWPINWSLHQANEKLLCNVFFLLSSFMTKIYFYIFSLHFILPTKMIVVIILFGEEQARVKKNALYIKKNSTDRHINMRCTASEPLRKKLTRQNGEKLSLLLSPLTSWFMLVSTQQPNFILSCCDLQLLYALEWIMKSQHQVKNTLCINFIERFCIQIKGWQRLVFKIIFNLHMWKRGKTSKNNEYKKKWIRLVSKKSWLED